MDNQPKRERPYAERSNVTEPLASVTQGQQERPMKSTRSQRTKGILAIGIGALLLSGGATTLAYWQSQQSVLSSDVTTGKMAVVKEGSPTYTLKGVWQATANTVSPTAVVMVPGDVLTIVQPIKLELQGSTLKAKLEAKYTQAVADPTLADNIVVAVTIAGISDPTALTAANNTGAGPAVNATITVTFNPDAPTAGGTNYTQTSGKTINATEIALVLTQVFS